MADTNNSSEALKVSALGRTQALIPIRGTSPLIVHRFSEKAKRAMLDAQQGRKKPKESRDPEAECEAAFYRLPDGRPGFPSIAFKQAVVGATRVFSKGLPMTKLKQAVFVRGELGSDGMTLTPVLGDPVMREDVVRIGMGSSDLRYRPAFNEWAAVLDVLFMDGVLSLDMVLSLVQAAGQTVGVGEWRPERSGDFGTFEIDPGADVRAVAL